MAFILILIQSLVVTAWLVLLIRVLMSWIDPQFQKPISQFVYSLTEPVLAPLRNVLPKAGMFDLSPLVLLLGLGFVMRVLLAA
jgi:YggT family protein